MRAILEREPWVQDPACVRMPWRSAEDVRRAMAAASSKQGRPIRIGVIEDDGVVRPVAPVRRALEEVKAKLKAADGETRFELKPVDVGQRHAEAWDLIRSLYFTDGGEVIKALADASGEPLLPLTTHILSDPSPQTALDANEIWYRQAQKESFRASYAAFFDSLEVDCLLCPISSAPAPRPEKILYWGYTSTWNLVDYPSISFPTGVVAQAEVDEAYDRREAEAGSSTRPKGGRWDEWQADEYETHRPVFDGAPICLQLVARRFHEEELLWGLAAVEKAIRA